MDECLWIYPIGMQPSHPGQLSLATLPWVGPMSTGEIWGINMHNARHTSPICLVSQCKQVSVNGLENGDEHHPIDLMVHVKLHHHDFYVTALFHCRAFFFLN